MCEETGAREARLYSQDQQVTQAEALIESDENEVFNIDQIRADVIFLVATLSLWGRSQRHIGRVLKISQPMVAHILKIIPNSIWESLTDRVTPAPRLHKKGVPGVMGRIRASKVPQRNTGTKAP